MPNEVMEGNERGTYSRARTSYVTGTRDGLSPNPPKDGV